MRSASRLKKYQVSIAANAKGVIEAREDFKDVDLVFPWHTPYMMKKQDHYFVMPFYVRHKDEEIRVTLKKFDSHPKKDYIYYMTLQRYLVGKPNLLCLPIYPVQQDKSLHWQASAHLLYLIKEINVWCFTDTYPARIEIDC